MGRKRSNKNKGDQLVSDKQFESDLFSCDRSPVFGRFLKAKVNIPKGTIILKENCLVAGPKSSSKPVCIGCHSDIVKISERKKCSKCNWPLCTSQCQSSPFHSLECKLFKEKNIQPPEFNYKDYEAIAPLRALLFKIYKPKDWKKFIALEHHNDERKNFSVWKSDAAVVKIIREKWNLWDLFSEDEIFSACGIFEINGFELGDYNIYGGIFPTAAMIAHDCIPNAGHFENLDDGVLEIITLLDIPAGSPITMCYDCSIKGTDERKKQLWRSKYFKCTCNRCEDPSELGTNFSTLLCDNPTCKRGLVMKSHFESEDGIWKCDKCSKIAPTEEVDLLVQKYSSLAANSLPTIKSKEEFLQECKSIFHPNHYIPFSVKFELCMAYGHAEGYTLYELTQAEGHRKLDLCQDVMKILDILTPGLTTSRGNILYEIQAAEVLISRNLLETGKCSKGLIKRRLQNTLKTLNEAIQIFELSYPMRMLAESAKSTTLVELKMFVNSLK